MVRVLIVDDSAFMRRSLSSLLGQSKDIEIVGTATNGKEAIARCREFDPDVVTLDIEMPVMDGLTALTHIMAEAPLPVLMISSLTSEGANITLRALEAGACDYVAKVTSSSLPALEGFAQELIAKVKAVARRKAFLRLKFRTEQIAKSTPTGSALSTTLGRTPQTQSTFRTTTSQTSREQALQGQRLGGASALAFQTKAVPPQTVHAQKLAITRKGSFDAIVIGVSTGGPPAVQKILAELPENFRVPILIAQHMPASFTGPFAERLNSLSKVTVQEVQEESTLQAGHVYICPGGKHMRLERKGGILKALITEEPKEALYKPSANILFETAAQTLGERVLGIVLTGMGYDGLEGAKQLKAKGSVLLAQSENSCVVYGMPKAVVEANLVDEIIDLDDMGACILKYS